MLAKNLPLYLSPGNDRKVPESIIPQLLVERSAGYERMSDVGERARTLKRRIVGHWGRRGGGAAALDQIRRSGGAAGTTVFPETGRSNDASLLG